MHNIATISWTVVVRDPPSEEGFALCSCGQTLHAYQRSEDATTYDTGQPLGLASPAVRRKRRQVATRLIVVPSEFTQEQGRSVGSSWSQIATKLRAIIIARIGRIIQPTVDGLPAKREPRLESFGGAELGYLMRTIQ